MKKAIVGAGALLAASILPVANVFAIDPLDYAKSVAQSVALTRLTGL